MQAKLSKQHFYLVRKRVAAAQARKGKCFWTRCEKYWESKTHETWNPTTLVSSGAWKHLLSPVFAEILSPASSSEPVIPLNTHFAEVIYGFSFSKARWLQSSESLWKGPSFGMYSTLTNLTAEKDPTSFPVRGFSLYYSTFP